MIKMSLKKTGSRNSRIASSLPWHRDCLYLAAAGLCNCASQSGLVVADLNIGILFFLMMAGLAVTRCCLRAGQVTTNTRCWVRWCFCADPELRSVPRAFPDGRVAQAGSFNMTDIVNSQAHVWTSSHNSLVLLPLPSRAWRCVPSPV